MVNYREILRLKSLNYSNVSVASSCGSSRNTVAEVWKLAQEKNLSWPIPDALTNNDIEQLLYPGRGVNEGRKLPDFEYIYNELAKPSVLPCRFFGQNTAHSVLRSTPFLISNIKHLSIYYILAEFYKWISAGWMGNTKTKRVVSGAR